MNTIKERIKYIIEKVLIQSKIALKDIIIFGSRARGNFEEGSDFDILIIIKNDINIGQKRNLCKEIYHELHKDFPITPFDVIVKTIKEFEDEKYVINTISNEAFIEGIKL